jgi:hypothetical protein
MALPKGYIMEPCPNCGCSPHKPGWLKFKKSEDRKRLKRAVQDGRRRGESWREIGRALGISHEQARLLHDG